VIPQYPILKDKSGRFKSWYRTNNTCNIDTQFSLLFLLSGVWFSTISAKYQ
jgi:hypothetical protein